MSLCLEFVLNIVDRKIFLTHGHDQLAYWVSGWRGLGSVVDLPEKTLLPILCLSELVAQDPEGAGGITEALGGFRRGDAFDEIGPQGLVLAM